MSDLLPAIAKRFSCREFINNRPLDGSKISLLLEAAGRAPSGCNRQPWRFVVCEDSGRVAEIAGFTYGQEFVKDASCVFVLLGDRSVRKLEYTKDRLHDLMDCHAFTSEEIETILKHEALSGKDDSKIIRDCAISAYSLMLQSTHLGLGSCWVSIKDKAGLRNLCRIPEDLIIVSVIAAGYPVDANTPPRVRFNVNEFSFKETFGTQWGKIENYSS